MDGIQQRFFICVHGFPPMVHRPAQWPYPALAFAPRFFRASPLPSVFPFSAIRSQTTRVRTPAVRANPVGVRKTRPLHSAFADRAVGKNGRQFSYKQNAEEGVRLDEQRRTMVRGRKGGRCRSFVMGWAWRRCGLPEPFCGPSARSRVVAGRCARIRIGLRIRIRMSGRLSDRAPLAGLAVSGRIDGAFVGRCACIECARDCAFPRFLHPDDTAAAHRDGRTTVSSGRRCLRARCRISGAVAGYGVSRENERRRGNTR
ncbi:hypothetical protein [Burkholderia metallica]|uniref:hypothetical protein n=1 Tax=Burkholderia metallica TaxID=488729 RepID=UPI00158381D9|nr:hypothetical protein [Burkholderia metallica]